MISEGSRDTENWSNSHSIKLHLAYVFFLYFCIFDQTNAQLLF